ncbi:hypothetical protein CDAR_477171 [Caerostris darwini]|uniref:Uncharacterized protein n=1 Tax=Caerostris darwini TaxID=1538125 RepID=A0AAV4TS04_9ARAC|nr:hypothetical protein CDAR_477171 [Caerostris darwini]
MWFQIKASQAAVSGAAMGEEAHQQRRREQLPDLVLHASPVLPRRSRSQSINLPPDVDQELVQSVGRELRRLSEDFEMSIEIRRLRLRQQSLRSTFRKSS